MWPPGRGPAPGLAHSVVAATRGRMSSQQKDCRDRQPLRMYPRGGAPARRWAYPRDRRAPRGRGERCPLMSKTRRRRSRLAARIGVDAPHAFRRSAHVRHFVPFMTAGPIAVTRLRPCASPVARRRLRQRLPGWRNRQPTRFLHMSRSASAASLASGGGPATSLRSARPSPVPAA